MIDHAGIIPGEHVALIRRDASTVTGLSSWKEAIR